MRCALCVLLFLLAFSTVPSPAPAAQSALDPEAATEAYLAQVPPDVRNRSDSYFEGGEWLILWDFLAAMGVAALFLGTGLSASLRDRAERLTRFRPLQTFFYAACYFLLTAILIFPLTLYEGFFRERAYGLLNQGFSAWMRDQVVGLLATMILGSLAVTVLYAVFRRAPRTWWIWGAVVSLIFLMLLTLIVPVFLLPLFLKSTELTDEKVRAPILALARSNGVETNHVWVLGMSEQSNRTGGNVSGLGSTMRISLNDNLLRRSSPGGVQAVMGHELGHYVLDHVAISILAFGVLILLGFAFLRWALTAVLVRRGERWRITGIADPAGLPLLIALGTLYFFLLTPVTNTITRTQEAEADLFGLNTARQPDGRAEVVLQHAEDRKLSPGPLEEFIFFDHPSGRNRILMAMRWKAEHLAELK
ncbi:MAG TPA: M48 family metallopeptidase [Thermoanaerobaculia bacterium]|jgi:STE24 endopeptidase|nr:M48 family metallopeptidase [Thermoanaerobaculia bacterium]